MNSPIVWFLRAYLLSIIQMKKKNKKTIPWQYLKSCMKYVENIKIHSTESKELTTQPNAWATIKHHSIVASGHGATPNDIDEKSTKSAPQTALKTVSNQ